jgi:hypothetical protein
MEKKTANHTLMLTKSVWEKWVLISEDNLSTSTLQLEYLLPFSYSVCQSIQSVDRKMGIKLTNGIINDPAVKVV